MFVVYKNENDSMELHYGKLLTSLSNINDRTIYIDVEPLGTLKEHKRDWKNQWISSVGMEKVKAFAETEESIRLNFPEEWF